MKLLIVSPWWDLSESDGTSTQVTNLLSLFQQFFKQMDFIISNRPNVQLKNPKINLNSTTQYKCYFFGIPTYHLLDYNPFFYREISQISKSTKFDAIFISYPWGLRYLRRKFPDIPIIYGANGYEKEFAEMVFSKLPSFIKKFVVRIIGSIEKKAVEESNLVISVGDLLTTQIRTNFSIDPNRVITIKMGFNFQEGISPVFDRTTVLQNYGLDPKRKYFIFHGGLKHPPNLEAANLIKDKLSEPVWNLDRNICFCIVGNGNPRSSSNNVECFPFIENLDEFMKCMTGAIMPIITGSGIRIKAMDYIKNKIPMVSTQKGIEGYGFTSEHLLITEDHIGESFIKGILDIAHDPKFGPTLAENCYIMAKNDLDNRILASRLKKALIDINLPLN